MGKKIKKINATATEKVKLEKKLEDCEGVTKSWIDKRNALVKELKTNLDKADQSALEGIKFGVEYGFDENIEEVTQKNKYQGKI